MPAAVKAISMSLGYLALALAFAALLTQLWRMGRPNVKPGPASLWVHRIAGYGAAALFLLLFLGMGVKVWRFGGDFSARVAWHAAAGFALAALLFAKWAVVRPFRNLMKLAPALGITTFVVAFAVINLAATVGLLSRAYGPTPVPPAAAPEPPPADKEKAAAPVDDDAADRILFAEKCGRCHHLAPVFATARTGDEWRKVIARMRAYDDAWIDDAAAARIHTYVTNK